MAITQNVLVIGAFGQLGSELAPELARLHGADRVLLTDVQLKPSSLPTQVLDVTDRVALEAVVHQHDIRVVYHLAAILSARGEQDPALAWRINMQGLMNVLDVCVAHRVQRLFWPSTIAVFGPSAPKHQTPQHTWLDPTSMYGITKAAGEQLLAYYHRRYGLDGRSIRYPGLISYSAPPGGGTTDYAVEVFHYAKAGKPYRCFLGPESALPMMYMPDAVRGTLELMHAEPARICERASYNLQALTFTPAELFAEIGRQRPDFAFSYAPDFRQAIADSWPAQLDDTPARTDWGWQPAFGLPEMVADMLLNVPVMEAVA
jgi:nucleoside-diphosphate-sugar epimerase